MKKFLAATDSTLENISYAVMVVLYGIGLTLWWAVKVLAIVFYWVFIGWWWWLPRWSYSRKHHGRV